MLLIIKHFTFWNDGKAGMFMMGNDLARESRNVDDAL